ncbi:hypothetical protein UlMin_026547 [Ulmus minor]
MTILRKSKGYNEIEPVKKKSHLHPGALSNILTQKKRASSKGQSSGVDMLHGSPVRKKRTALRQFAAPVRVVIDSPPALGTRAATRRLVISREPSSDDNMTDMEMSPVSSRKTRRSLNDEVEGLIEGEPSDNELALEQMAEDLEQVVEENPKQVAGEDLEQVADMEPSRVSPQKSSMTSPVAVTNQNPKSDKENTLRKSTRLQNTNDTVQTVIEKAPLNQNEIDGLDMNTNKKKTRGRTTMSSLGKKEDELIKIKWNIKGQPIGFNSVQFSSYLGALVREIVPYTLTCWKRLPKTKEDILWASIQAKYDLPKVWHKKMCFKMMADLWRASKSRLVTAIIDAKSESERLALKPDCIKSDVEWRAFVKQKTSKEHMVLREKFQERRKKRVPSTLSRKGYARTIDEMVNALHLL